jgi:hypothetical protein
MNRHFIHAVHKWSRVVVVVVVLLLIKLTLLMILSIVHDFGDSMYSSLVLISNQMYLLIKTYSLAKLRHH